LKSKKAAEVADRMAEWIGMISVPRILQCDNGGEFKECLLVLLKEEGIKIINGRSCHPQTQGMVEQTNDTLKRKLHFWMVETGKTNWSRALPGIVWAMKTSTHSGLPHGKTPYEVMFGWPSRWGSFVPFSWAQNAIIENIPNEDDPDHIRDPIEDQLDDEELFEDYINLGKFLKDDIELNRDIDPRLQRRLGNLTPLEKEVQAHNTIVQKQYGFTQCRARNRNIQDRWYCYP
jgi:hypothetical protein